ncbi:MAG TPA: CCA tRNA nucleotidyltransferase, partial [Nitrososphaerales archaeon]|nr:CCA tRNA nucleotidyltransferase [Nitrososphaerales archaeon]
MQLSAVIEKAAKLVTPNPQEIKKLETVAEKVSSRLKNVFIGISPAPEINLGGSYARGTWLKGSLDIDYFIMYPPDYPRERLEGEAIKLARKALHGYRINLRFAEHPYVEGFVDGVRVNLVPCYKVPLGEWKSAADRSPYHTKYILSKLDDRLRLESRLLKKFVKSKGVYGAEVKIQGFSGYVCEVLVLKYGSFLSVLEGLAKLDASAVISLEPYDKDLAASFKSQLVILDPVDTTRNLGTAISARNVAKLVLEARRFIANPKLSSFAESKVKRSASRELLARTIVVSFKNKKRSPDILWGQLRKSSDAISNKLEL